MLAGTVTVGVFLFALELAVRFLIPVPRVSMAAPAGQEGYTLPHPVLNHVWRPNFSYEHQEHVERGYGPWRVSFNSQGWLESYDVSLEKPAGVFRIFYVGDSFTETPAPIEESVPNLVEKKLSGLFERNALRVEVVNTGTGGYSTMIYYLLIKHYLLNYSPDLVVVNLDMTDVFEDFLYRATAVYDSEGELMAVRPGHPLKEKYRRTKAGLEKIHYREKIFGFLTAHSRLAWFAAAGVRRVKEQFRGQEIPKALQRGRKQTKPDVGMFDWCALDWSAKTEENVRFSMETLRSILRLAKARGVKIAVTAVPHKEHFLKEGDPKRYSLRPLEEVRKVSEEEGIPYLDSFGGLRGRIGDQSPDAFYIPGDMHFNHVGNESWSEIHSGFLLDPKNGLIPEEILRAVRGIPENVA